MDDFSFDEGHPVDSWNSLGMIILDDKLKVTKTKQRVINGSTKKRFTIHLGTTMES